MANEPIDEQLKKAEPEGNLGRWASKVFSKKGLTVLVIVVGFWLMSRSKPQGPAQASPLQPKQQIIEESKPAPAPQTPPKQTIAPDPVMQPPGAVVTPGYAPAQTEQKEDPVKVLQDKRRELLINAAFQSNLTMEKEEPKDIRQSAPTLVLSSAGNGLETKLPPVYLLPEGTVAEAVLDSRLEGEMTGPVDAHIATDVYIPGTRTLVIPQGAKALGEANKVGSFGQQRLAVTFHAIQIFAHGQPFCTIQLAHDPGLDQQGATGIGGKVNNHMLSLILATSAIGIIQGATIGATYGNGGFSVGSSMMNGVATGSSQAIERVLEPFLNRVPRITVPEGTRIKLRFIRDTPSSCEVSQ
jgi:type IV secretory pathway VirB10-like protein